MMLLGLSTKMDCGTYEGELYDRTTKRQPFPHLFYVAEMA